MFLDVFPYLDTYFAYWCTVFDMFFRAQVISSGTVVSMVNIFFLKGPNQNQGFKHKRR